MGGGGVSARRHPCADQARPRPAVEFTAGTPVERAGPARRVATARRPALVRHTTQFFRAAEPPPDAGRFVNAAQTLDMLRDFSSILTHSLNAEAMLKQFLLFLREILSVNRAAIFLNRPGHAARRGVLTGETAAGSTPWPPSAFPPACSNILNCRSMPASAASSPGSGTDSPPRQRRGARRRRDAKGI